MEKKFIEKYGLARRVDKTFAASDATLWLDPAENLCYASGATIAGTVYLPPVTECAGGIYHVQATSVAIGNVTVKPWETAAGVAETVARGSGGEVTSWALATAKAFVTLYSTGYEWIVLNFDLSV
jgi:hypothetical protein